MIRRGEERTAGLELDRKGYTIAEIELLIAPDLGKNRSKDSNRKALDRHYDLLSKKRPPNVVPIGRPRR
jgi:hypothetical protein